MPGYCIEHKDMCQEVNTEEYTDTVEQEQQADE